MSTPLQMLIMMLAGWVNEHQCAVIAYLEEENRVPKRKTDARLGFGTGRHPARASGPG